ncbi:MAG: putative toxin-antitoxin system toxin component, PIN family [Selenomonadaceae bacterium]|nr:putative toxin-antitoxin system toxin component, PIN family [Selenomonadaceae bacterium]
MNFYAVIDTNVVISAMLKPNSIPGEIVNLVADGKIIPLFDEKILAEYTDVINRPKFKFSQERIESILSRMTSRGQFIEAKDFEDELPDPKDVIFYHVVLTAREDVDAYLVMGNLKHFPQKIFIVTPREMFDIIERDGDSD